MAALHITGSWEEQPLANSFKTILMGAAGTSLGDYWIFHYGETQAQNALPTTSRSIAVDSNNNVITVGEQKSNYPSNGAGAPFVTKIATDGSLVWARYIYASASGTDRGAFTGVGTDSSDNVFIFGQGFFPNNNLPTVTKYNSSGSLQYIKGTSTAKGEFFNGGVSPNGTPYAVGYIAGNLDLTVHRFNSAGGAIAEARLNTDRGIGFGVAFDSSNNCIAAGSGRLSNTSIDGISIVLMKASDNTFAWGKTISTANADYSLTLGHHPLGGPDSNNDFAMIWQSNRDSQANSSSVIHKFAGSNAAPVWKKKIVTDDGRIQIKDAVAVDADDNWYLIGHKTKGSESERVLIMKLNSSGALQWANKLTVNNVATEVNGRFTDIKIDSNGDILACACVQMATSGVVNSQITFKVPTSGEFTGTFGDFVFTSVTSDITVSNDTDNNYINDTTREADMPGYGNVGNTNGTLNQSTELVDI